MARFSAGVALAALVALVTAWPGAIAQDACNPITLTFEVPVVQEDDGFTFADADFTVPGGVALQSSSGDFSVQQGGGPGAAIIALDDSGPAYGGVITLVFTPPASGTVSGAYRYGLSNGGITQDTAFASQQIDCQDSSSSSSSSTDSSSTSSTGSPSSASSRPPTETDPIGTAGASATGGSGNGDQPVPRIYWILPVLVIVGVVAFLWWRGRGP